MKPLIEAMKCHPFSWNLWLLTQNSPEYREKVNETIGKKQFLTVNYFFAKRQRIDSKKISLFSMGSLVSRNACVFDTKKSRIENKCGALSVFDKGYSPRFDIFDIQHFY